MEFLGCKESLAVRIECKLPRLVSYPRYHRRKDDVQMSVALLARTRNIIQPAHFPRKQRIEKQRPVFDKLLVGRGIKTEFTVDVILHTLMRGNDVVPSLSGFAALGGKGLNDTGTAISRQQLVWLWRTSATSAVRLIILVLLSLTAPLLRFGPGSDQHELQRVAEYREIGGARRRGLRYQRRRWNCWRCGRR